MSASSMTMPLYGAPFGTKVTFWDVDMKPLRAVLIDSPADAQPHRQWGIVMPGNRMTFVARHQLTIGWHPDAQ